MACRALFERTDAEIRAAGVGDGGVTQIDGFPWLRANRVLASFHDELDSAEQVAAWLDQLAALDRKARSFELRNLDAGHRRRLRESWLGAAEVHDLPGELEPALEECRARLNARLQADGDALDALHAAAVVPDDYVGWWRVLGLYPLTSRIARARVVALHARLGERFGEGIAADGAVVHYAVTGTGPALAPGLAARLAVSLPRDALGIPQPDPVDGMALLAAHAPVWAIEVRGEADRPGALGLAAGLRPVVDVDERLEYRWLSWTRFGGRVLLQLNYALWFTERPPQGRLDIVAGHLDGLVWRVTLDTDGDVLAYDSIHSCGCYYTLLPGEGWRAVTPGRHEEPVFAPGVAPAPTAGERLFVALESGTHYLVGVAAREPPEHVLPLSPVSMASLRSLPEPGGGRASVYRPDGLIPASRRPERFLLWPLGVRSAGAMRQPGRHAIAFIGRRHFDDPHLLQELLRPEGRH